MRIIAGKFKGLNIKTINDPSTRPMMSRAREGIFNSLQNDFNNSLVLDLFAGSGSLGIEALSRGASFVTFVDSSVDCKKIIDKNLSDIDQNFTVLVLSVHDYITQSEKKFDIIFYDPPFSFLVNEINLDLNTIQNLMGKNSKLIIHRHNNIEKMKILIPGSFDPPTNGHIDVIKRSSSVFDEVIVGVVVNPQKESMFDVSQRENMLIEILKDYKNVEIKRFEGLLVDFAKQMNVSAIVKGLRAMTDFDYEFQMAQMNFNLADFETIFIAASPEYGYVSSSMVKEIFSYGGDVNALVPSIVVERLKDV